jgi:hypothetical protein
MIYGKFLCCSVFLGVHLLTVPFSSVDREWDREREREKEEESKEERKYVRRKKGRGREKSQNLSSIVAHH